jgi:hypothetical protein
LVQGGDGATFRSLRDAKLVAGEHCGQLADVARKARQFVRSKKAGYEFVLSNLVTLIDAGRKATL